MYVCICREREREQGPAFQQQRAQLHAHRHEALGPQQLAAHRPHLENYDLHKKIIIYIEKHRKL
jgi:hypothetical protein